MNRVARSQAVRFTAAGPTVTAIPFLNVTDTSSGPTPRGTSSDGSVLVGISTNNTILVNDVWSGQQRLPLCPGRRGLRHSHACRWHLEHCAGRVAGWQPRARGRRQFTSAPNGEAYLYNATSTAVTPLGTPAAGWGLNSIGGMTPDGSVVVLNFFDLFDPAGAAFLRNGFRMAQRAHDRGRCRRRSHRLEPGRQPSEFPVDGTRIWGSGSHNGNVEGWVAEFPVGYLAAYGASLPAQSIVGAWSGSVTTRQKARAVVTFLSNGTYFDVEDARVADGPGGFDGYERGTYTWNPVTKAFTLTTLIDNNGDVGLTAPGGCPPGRRPRV